MADWSHSDAAALREHYPDATLQELIARFKRSRFSIQSKAAALGLHKGPGYLERPGSGSPGARPLKREAFIAQCMPLVACPEGASLAELTAFTGRARTAVSAFLLRSDLFRAGASWRSRYFATAQAADDYAARLAAKPPKKRGWSAEHVACLQQFFVSHGSQHVAALVGRRVRAVQYMATRMGLRSAHHTKRPHEWTDEQLAQLRAFYSTHGPEYVAALTGRKLKSVYCKAAELKVKSPRQKAEKAPKPKKAAVTRAPRPFIPQRMPSGPAYLPGPLITTARTRHIVYPTPAAPTRTNTYSIL